MSKNKKQTVLIVDDFPSMRNALKGLLIKQGFVVAEAEDGLDALKRLKKKDIDLIFSDIVMPQMDGFELCERIKSDKQFMSIPLVMVSTQTDSKYVMKALKLGADDYIVKPVREDILTKVIQRVSGVE